MSTPITILPGSLPAGFCYPTDPQDLNLAIVSRIAAFLNENFPGVYVGATAPPADQRDRVWFNTNNGRWYHFTNGDWYTESASIPGPDGRLMIWSDSEADLWSFEGGDGTNPATNTPTLFTGSMWEVDHTMDTRVPIGAGTLPSTTVLNQGDTGGAEKITLGLTNIPYHKHFVAAVDSVSGTALTAANQVAQGRSDDNYVLDGSTKDATVGLTSGTGGNPASTPAANATDPVTILPLYKVIFFAKRTIRAWEKI